MNVSNHKKLVTIDMDGTRMRIVRTGVQKMGWVRLGPIVTLMAVAALLFFLQPSILIAESPPVTVSTPPTVADSTGYVTNGTVNAIAHSGSKTYIGGGFSMVGPRTGHGVPISTGDGSPTSGFPDVAGGSVLAAAPDGSGGWYIGGNFTKVGGVELNRIAHVNADMTVDSSWNPNADDTVYALDVSGSTVYAGGRFLTMDGQTRKRIAAIDSNGSVTAWNPNAKNSYVYAVAVSADGNTVYAGGSFTNIGGSNRNRIAALDTSVDTNNATGWNPDASATVRTIAISGSTVYIGGEFTTVNGIAITRNRAAAFATSSDTATAWNPNASGTVHSIAPSCDSSTVYLGGEFTTLTFGVASIRRYLAETNASDGSSTGWSPNGPSGGDIVRTLELSCTGGTTNAIYAGGDFTDIGGTTRNYIAAIDSAGSKTSWNPSAESNVHALALSGSNIFAGGDFVSVGVQSRTNIAELDVSGQLTSCAPSSNGTVWALAFTDDGNTVYAGGEFTTFDGQSRNRVAALNSNCQVTVWNPNASDTVRALAVSGNTVYAGGNFSGSNSIGGADRNRIAALDASSGTAARWDPDAGNTVRALTVSGNTVYVGGGFNGASSIGGEARNYIAAIDASSGNATGWDPNAESTVRALALAPDGATVYAGGNFTTIGGQSRITIAAIDASSGLATNWNPSSDNTVRALAVAPDGNTIYAGGNFTIIDAQTRRYLAALDSSGNVTSWNPNAGGIVRGLVALGPTVYAGGDFTNVGVQSNKGFAQFTAAPTNSVVPAISGSGVADEALTCGSGTWNDENATYSYQWLRDGSTISGATSTSYTSTSDDVGSSIACRVTATNVGGSTVATSNPITVTAADPSPGTTPPAGSTPSTPVIENLTVKPSCYRARATKASKKSKRSGKSSRKRSRTKGKKSKRSRGKVRSLSRLAFKFTLTQGANLKVSIRRRLKSKAPRSCPSSKKKRGGINVPGSYAQVDSYTEFASAGQNSAYLSVTGKKKAKRAGKKAGKKKRAAKRRAKKRRARKRRASSAIGSDLTKGLIGNGSGARADGSNSSDSSGARHKARRAERRAESQSKKASKREKRRARKALVSTAFGKSAKAGENTVGVAGGLNVKNLKPGTYKVYVAVLDSAGNTLNEATVKFWVLRR